MQQEQYVYKCDANIGIRTCALSGITFRCKSRKGSQFLPILIFNFQGYILVFPSLLAVRSCLGVRTSICKSFLVPALIRRCLGVQTSVCKSFAYARDSKVFRGAASISKSFAYTKRLINTSLHPKHLRTSVRRRKDFEILARTPKHLRTGTYTRKDLEILACTQIE